MSRGYTPRHDQTAGDMGFAVQFNAVGKYVLFFSNYFNMFYSVQYYWRRIKGGCYDHLEI